MSAWMPAGGPRTFGACSVALLLALGVLATSGESFAQARPFLPGTIADPASWRGAAPAGAVVTGPNGPELTIRQTTPRATLDWLRFDIGRGETVRFDQQGNRDWAALNRVLDPSGRPSQIAGRMVADGQIYLINQNGIVFTPTAQVDVNSLIASTLTVNPDAFLRGLLSVRQGTAQFELGSGNPDARIEVQGIRGPDGRTLVQAATINAQDGGRIFLLAAKEVVNAGRLVVRDGQVILAAGEKAYLFAPAEGSGSSLRGLFVEVDGGTTATNLGEIVTSRGNTTMIGLAVNQSGRISANSAELGNGSVWLLARSGLFFDPNNARRAANAGKVTLSKDSVTELRPEGGGTGVVDSVSLNPSEVRIEGARVHLQGEGSTGAAVSAPGGRVSIVASAQPGVLPDPNAREPAAPADSRLLIDGGVRVDVSGVRGVEVSASRNVVGVELRGDVIADAPLLRDSPLAGQTLYVDVRTGSPLFGGADTVQRVAASQIRRSIDERSTSGGTVSLQSDGDLVVNPGAAFGISGGTVRYLPGELRVSRLSDGRSTLSASQATPDRSYAFVVDRYQTYDARWNVRRVYDGGYRSPVDPGYVDGRPAGNLLIAAPFTSWAGSIEAGVEVGAAQRQSPPPGGLFSIGERTQLGQRFADYRVLSPLVLTDVLAQAIAAVLPEQDRASVFGTAEAPIAQRIDGAALAAGGVSRVELLSNTSVTVAPGAPWVLPTGGRITLSANRVEVGRDLRVPSARGEAVVLPNGASVSVSGIEITAPFTAGDVDLATGGPTAGATGAVVVGAGVSIDASARWLVDPAGVLPATTTQGWLRDGGSVRIAGATDLRLGQGARVDASGGALRDASRRLTGGDGGRIALQITGRGEFGDSPPPAAGTLSIDGATLRSNGFAQNGTLQLNAPNVVVGAAPATAAAATDRLVLAPSFFESGAFGRYEINAADTLAIGPGRIAPRQLNFGTDQRGGSVLDEAALREVGAPRLLDDAVRRPVSMSFAATSPYRATLTVDRGALIDGDPRASLRFASDVRLTFDGTATARGGSVEISTGRANRDTPLALRPDEVLRLGSSASVDVSGIDLPVTDPSGRVTGAVLAGGTVDIGAARGALGIEPGARIDVSGAAGQRDTVTTASAPDAAPSRTTLVSDAGRVSISAGAGGYAAPTLVVRPGGVGAAAASVEVRHAPGDADSALPRILTVTDSPTVRTAATAASATLATDPAVRIVDPATGDSRLEFRVDARSIVPEGPPAGSLALAARDRVLLDTGVPVTASRSLQVSSAELAVSSGTPRASLSAPAVQVGQPISQSLPVVATPTAGDARLTIGASTTVDFVGRVAISGVRQVDVRTDGDIRFSGQYEQVATPTAVSRGELAVGGALSLSGQRLYPTTLSDYTVRVTAPEGRITLGAVGAEGGPPLSALGSLTLSAATVAGQARLYAPLGSLTVNAGTAIDLAAGSLLSVSGGDAVVPVGQALSGFDWVYQVDAARQASIVGLPAKAVSLSAPSIDLREGARVDVRGGGDVLGREFIRGQAGSVDVLAAPNVFAVMPGGGSIAPRDASVAIEDATARASGTSAFRGALPSTVGVLPGAAPRAGDSITVGDSPLLAAGTYTLLPARYGLLPGSRLVVLARPGTVPQAPTLLSDGSWWVPAYRGNTSGERDAGWSSAAVLDADALARWSRYDQVTGSTYFGAKAGAEGVEAMNGAADAGRLSLEGRTRLALAGQLQLDGGKPLSVAADGSIIPAPAAPTGARGTLELSADRLSIGGTATPGAVDVSTGFLASLLPRTLSLGVTTQAGGTPAIRASAVEVAPGVTLTGERVIVGATEQVRIGAGATLSAPPSGTPRRADAPDALIGVGGDGALLAALGDSGERLARNGAAVAGGTIELASGARIVGARAELDAATLAVSPQATIDAPDVRIAADRLWFGGGPSADTTTTAFDAAQSAALSSRSRFEAVSRSAITVAGDLRLGGESTERIRLQAPELVRDPASGAGDTVVRAARVEIAGTGPAVDAPPVAGNGSGTLSIASTGGPDAASSGVVLSGRASFAGFGSYTVSAAGTEAVPGRVVLDGTGSLRTDAPTSITANAVVGSAAADYSVASAGALTARGSARPDAAAGAGARIELTAPSIDVGTAILARSGSVTLNATGAAPTDSVVLRPGAVIDASGASAQVFDQRLDAPGGRIELSARAGSIVAEGGATMDVSAVAGVRGGTVSLSAAAGRVTAADATLRGARPGEAPGAAGASLQVDADRVDQPERLLGTASASGFGRELSVRQRTGDLRIGTDATPATLEAASIQLSADAGRLEFTGTLGGVPGSASRIALLSNDRVVLGNGTRITATGGADGSEGGRGGSVLLSGRNGFAFGAGVNVSAAASPVAGPMGSDGGTVELRFDAAAAPTLLQPGTSTPTLGAPGGRIVLTGVQSLVAGATLGQADIDATRADSDTFVGQRAALVSTLGLPADAPVLVRPELLFEGAPGAPVSVTGNVNLAGYRAGGAAGVLTIRSLSDLEITGRPIVSSRGLSAVISDGFVDGGARAAPLADPQGWSFRLVAGADAASADPMAVRPASDGDLLLGADRAIRTSTGDISLAAARDIRIGQPDGTTAASRDAAVYTAGTPAPAIASFELPPTAQRPAYTYRGGDVSIRAGRDVLGAESGQLASNWLFRRGAIDASGNVPMRGDANTGYVYAGTSWGPRIDAFRQNVGALGGGGVDVVAGRDVSNLSVAVPTSGRFYGPSDRPDPAAARLSSTVLGGGSAAVEAGRDVISGSVTLQRGNGALRAGRSVTGGRDVFGTDTGTIVQLGDAALTVEAGASVRIERAIDPTMLPQPINAARTYFSTQGDATRLTIRAAGGDASLRSADNGAVGLFEAAGVSTLTGDTALSAAFGPHTLTLEALTRDVIVGNVDVRLAPSARGDLRLIAARNVTGTAAGEPTIVMLDYDPSTLFAPRAPVPEATIGLTTQFTRVVGGTRVGAAVPLHAGDPTVARVYAGRGDVSYDPSSGTAWRLESAKPIEIRAGRDVVNLALVAKHPDVDDRTLVSAGRDIVAPVPRTSSNLVGASKSKFSVGGAGLLELIAGRDIRLGSGGGVETRGNLDDSALPVAGASIVLVAGLPDGPDYRAFLDAYAAPGATRGRGYDTELTAFLKTAGVPTDGLDAAGRWAALQALPEARRAVFARLAFFTELREAARAAADPASPTAGDYQRAYDALAVLFPKDGVGNIELVFSKVRTERGGDIQMFAPGEVCRGAYAACTPGAGGEFVGNILAGLLTPQPVESFPKRSPTDSGILTLGGGSIQGVAGNNVAVNQSRVFTVAGGDILLWSSFGDIDAGRGSRTAIASPPPVVTVDPLGNVRVDVPGAASGSGIGTLITRSDVQPGSVDLYAPRGAIDAGEAGIRVSGSAFLGAGEIRNAGAISTAGPSVGVPTANTSSNVSLASAGSSAASATRAAGDSMDRDASDAASRQRTASKVLILEFLGFGDEGEDAYRRRQQRGR
jgi:hypothetical protein